MTDFFEFREKIAKKRTEPPPPPKDRAAKALTISELTRQIERAIQTQLPDKLFVRGEMSNVSMHGPSGHLYFTLKDENACIDCVMWRSDVERMKFKPTDGMDLLASGSVSVYAQRGRYQLYVKSLSPLGQGALELAFQQLRKKLEAEGLFNPERRKPIPKFPRRIAIVTGAQAAALHDVLKVLRRYSWLRLFLYAVPVQGEGAAGRIAEALTHLSQRNQQIGGIDVILLARGGGSLEDLWAFNEEIVARAIAASSIPVVTGVGHEVDVSIADLVADYHAHTPTEAAQVITAQWRNAADAIEASTNRLRRGLRTLAQQASLRLAHVTRHPFFRRPLDRINSLRQLLDDRERSMRAAMKDRLWRLNRELAESAQLLAEHSPTVRLRLARQHLKTLNERLTYTARIGNKRRLQQLDALERELNAVSPEAVLRRGYSMTTLKKGGAVVRSVKQISGGEKLITRLADGAIESTADDPKQPDLF